MQERATALTEEIGPGRCVTGSLPAGLGGLAAVEALLDPGPSPGPPVRLSLWRAELAEPLRSAWAQPVGGGYTRFAFEPVAGGAALDVCLDAAAPSGARAWRGEQPEALTLRAFRRSDPGVAVVDAAAAVGRWPWSVAAGLALLVAPGLALAGLVERRRDVALAAAPGLSLLVLALAWWAASLVGAHIGAVVLAVATAVGAAGGARLMVGDRRSGAGDAAWLGLLWLAVVIARLAPVRDLALPAWVDGVHHAYLTELLTRGAVPEDFGPLLGFGPFTYHFGFHALAASVALASGEAAADAVLVAGQLLGAAAAPAAYLLARLYGGSARAGLAAGAAAGLVSVMPAYYVSWSRFTQLAGLVALPALLLLVARARECPRLGLAAGAAGAGLLLVHPRVALLAALAIAAEQVVGWRGWRGLALAAAAALLAAGPWLAWLAGSLVPRLGAAGDDAGQANALDLTPIQTSYDPYFYGLAAAALVGGLVGGSRAARVAALWLALALLAANPAWLGLPGTYLLSNGALVIALWLPAAALVGHLVAWAGGFLGRWVPARAAAPAILIGGIALGRPALEAVNPSTVLATPADRRALEATARVLPSGAVVAVNVREWQLATYMGSDAGYWVGVVTPGRAIVPPLLYGLGPPESARATSTRLRAWEQAQGDPAALVAAMRAARVEWIFVGERGPPAPPGPTPVVIEGRAGLFRLR